MANVHKYRLIGQLLSKPLGTAMSYAIRAKLRFYGVDFGSGLIAHGIPILSVAERSTITIGQNVVLCSLSKHTALGVNHPVVLRTLVPEAELHIGDNVGISGGVICAGHRVTIGANSMLGANVTITDTNFHPIHSLNRRGQPIVKADCKPVAIGENVFIGTNSIVLKGVSIGDNTVVGANSTVTHDLPANVVAGGVPCRVIKKLEV